MRVNFIYFFTFCKIIQNVLGQTTNETSLYNDTLIVRLKIIHHTFK